MEFTITSVGEDVSIDGVQLTQDSPGVPGQAENGDRWGAPITGREESFAAAAVGESVGDESGAGAVIVRGRTDEGYELLTQDTAGLTGTAEAGDRFGSAITSFLPSYEDPDERRYPVQVGVPGEDLERAETPAW